MRVEIIKTINGLCVFVPSKHASEIADILDATPYCNVTEIRSRIKCNQSKLICVDLTDDAEEQIRQVLKPLDYDKD